MKNKILPAIIAKSQRSLYKLLKRYKFADTIQLDVMDGKFVKNKSLMFNFKLPKKQHFEAHLMVKEPYGWVENHYDKVSKIIFHHEAVKSPQKLIKLIREKKKKVGIAINPKTPVSRIKRLLDKVDHVLVMTVHPGKYGSEFLPETLEKVKELRKLRPDLDIEVDGHINATTCYNASVAGANLLVSGSYLLGSDDVKESYLKLRKCLNIDYYKELKLMADKLRVHSIMATTEAGSGHPTTCMSAAEIMSVLFFNELKKDDEFILSKGHAAPILWAAYAEAGIIPVKSLMTLRKFGSQLEGHPTPSMKMVKIATGSLGQGLSSGVGMALGFRLNRSKGKVYVLLGDGEMAEGSVWEAANSAAFFNLDNLIAVVDVNRLGQSRETMHGHNFRAYQQKFEAFGWNTAVVDGHNVKKLIKAFELAKKSKKPFAIIAKTFKGKGFSEVENKNGWHGKAFDKAMMQRALDEIPFVDIGLKSEVSYKPAKYEFKNYKENKYSLGECIATREAFGNALVALASKNKNVVVIDGDVGNSTYTEKFMEKYASRGFQGFIAEQNMAGMALGISTQGFIPFASTFAAFWTRAHDFIRMAQYSAVNVNFIGTHAGVSIGEDGPSQMGLEDISMFLSMPHSVVLYPFDAVSTEKLVKEMARHKGISYLRATRAKTPVVYDNNEKFPLGKFKVLRQSKRDKALVIAAGITLHEALKAYDKLKRKRTNIRVVDLYSIKPVDEKGLRKHAKECKNNVIVVEDHYFGGIGSVVSEAVGAIKHLYVKDIPKSGKPDELLKKYKIDSAAIIKAVK